MMLRVISDIETRGTSLKPFFFFITDETENAKVFVLVRPFQPSLMFEIKARSLSQSN
jgi:hypothetical protein